MASYISFTKEQKKQATQVDLEALLRSRGEKLLSSGHDKRLVSDHSITIHGNEWFDHAICKGGNSISFMQYHYGLSYQEAMCSLLGLDTGEIIPPASAKAPPQPKKFVLPKANPNMRRVFAYLIKDRCISHDVISYFAKGHSLYEDAKHHNAVFVGFDSSGIPKHAHRHSTSSLGKPLLITVEGSLPQYSFHHIGTNSHLYVFEAPIDLLSYITLHPDNWEESSYLACCGTSPKPVLYTLQEFSQIKTVHLCLDNDEAGLAASQRMTELLSDQGVQTEVLLPTLKDWNDDLVSARESEMEVTETCPTLS